MSFTKSVVAKRSFITAGTEGGRRQYGNEEEDQLLQFAIQQSLIESGTENEEVRRLFVWLRFAFSYEDVATSIFVIISLFQNTTTIANILKVVKLC